MAKKKAKAPSKETKPQLAACPQCGGQFPQDKLLDHIKATHLSTSPVAQPQAPHTPPPPERKSGGTASLPPPEQQPWLDLNSLAEIGGKARAVIQNIREGNSNYGPSVILDLNINGKLYSLTVNANSSKHFKLHEAFGPDWQGHTIDVRFGSKAKKERETIVIEIPEQSSQAQPAKDSDIPF